MEWSWVRPLVVDAIDRSGGVERIQRPGAVLVGEEAEIRAGAPVAVAHHDVAGDGLEARAEVLARLDEDEALAARVDPAVGEDPEIRGLAAPLGDDDLH